MMKSQKYGAKHFLVIGALVITMTLSLQSVKIPNMEKKVYAAESTKFQKATPEFLIESRSATTATIRIDKLKDAKQYKIYRRDGKKGDFHEVGTTKSLTFKDTGLKSNTSYEYKIRAYQSKQKTKYSKTIKVNATLKEIKQLSANYQSQSVQLAWSSLDGASSYKIYRATSKNGTYSYIGSSKTVKYSDKTVKEGKQYYYRVRGVKTTASIKYNGVYSKKVSVKCVEKNSNSSFVEEVVRLVNIERKKEGLSNLAMSTKLNQAAQVRAVETTKKFEHTRPDGSSCFTVLEEFNISYFRCGENIAYGQATPKDVVNAWMNSQGHRANIMNSKFTTIGIGCYNYNGSYYWTQLFIG